MLKGGVIMDVTNVEEARIAEEAGAVAVMALERVPADIRRDGGVARMRCTPSDSAQWRTYVESGGALLVRRKLVMVVAFVRGKSARRVALYYAFLLI